MSSVAGIVLAAGSSLRLGTAKQLVRLGDETLLERAVRMAFEAGLQPVLGVISPHLLKEAMPMGMVRVVNQHAAEGMAASIRAGVGAVTAEDAIMGVVLLACDQPAVTPEHLRALANGGSDLVASVYSGRKGIPAYFPKEAFESLQALRGATGARDLLRNARAVPLPLGELDIDTVQDLADARKLYGS